MNREWGLVFDDSRAHLAVPGILRNFSAAAAIRFRPAAGLEPIPPPQPPTDSWLRLRPISCGVCGSDVIQMTLHADSDNPLRGLLGFPHVMGHEVVARTEEGETVAVDPNLGCEVWDRPLCGPCQEGHSPQCEHAGELHEGRGQGMHLGNTSDLPGGFSTAMVAHRSRVHPLPPGLDPGLAVLTDPVAVALNAVERAEIDPGTAGYVLVLGAGTIGLCVTAVLRARYPNLTPLVTALWPHLVQEVSHLGAKPLPVAHEALVEEVQRLTGGRILRHSGIRPWIVGGGVPVVIDTIASASATQAALACSASRARIVEVGVHRPGRTENTLRYYKEVELRGANAYGRLRDGRPATAVALEMLAQGAVPASRWVTHSFPLREWKRAFLTAATPQKSGAIKVSINSAVEGL